MRREDQIRMLLHPEEYGEEQVGQMLDEANIPAPDADEAWARWSKRTRGDSVSTLRPLLKKLAAMFAGVLMLSGIAYAAYHLVQGGSVGDDLQSPPKAVRVPSSHEQAAVETPQDSTLWKPVVYENAELATILDDIAAFHRVETVYRSEATKHVRLYFTWDKAAKLNDVISTFNKFDRIHIAQENQKLIVE